MSHVLPAKPLYLQNNSEFNDSDVYDFEGRKIRIKKHSKSFFLRQKFFLVFCFKKIDIKFAMSQRKAAIQANWGKFIFKKSSFDITVHEIMNVEELIAFFLHFEEIRSAVFSAENFEEYFQNCLNLAPFPQFRANFLFKKQPIPYQK